MLEWKRITKRYIDGYPLAINGGEFEAVRYCCEIEDLEDEMCIDALTLLLALKNGIWVNDKMPFESDKLALRFRYANSLKDGYLHEYISDQELELKDYGETWALNKAELKKVKK